MSPHNQISTPLKGLSTNSKDSLSAFEGLTSNTSEPLASARMDALEANFIRFFKLNQQSKDLMHQTLDLPSDSKFWNDERLEKVLAKGYLKISSCIAESIQLLEPFDCVPGFVRDAFRSKLKDLNEAEASIDRKSQTLRASYERLVAGMDSEFAIKVKSEIIQYQDNDCAASSEILKSVKTQTELLHLLHTYTLQNYKIYNCLPNWKNLVNDGQPESEVFLSGANFVGIPNETSLALAKAFLSTHNAYHERDPEVTSKWSAAPPDIVTIFSQSDQIWAVVRDFGHALCLNIIPDPQIKGNLYVNYSIPKPFSEERIASLPGLDDFKEVRPSDGRINDFAKGGFSIFASDVGPAIMDFVRRVPADGPSTAIVEPWNW